MTSIDSLASTLTAEARGSVGDRVFSRNATGPYSRARTPPTGLPSFAQTRQRNLMTAASSRWANLMPSFERPHWYAYAARVPRHNALAQPFIDQPRNWFLGTDILRTVAYENTIFKAPRQFRRTHLTPFSVIYYALTDLIHVTFDPSDEWHDQRTDLLILFQSQPVSPGTYSRCQPYRYLGHVKGRQTPPAKFRPVWRPYAPQCFFVRGIALTNTNYMSRSHYARGIAI